MVILNSLCQKVGMVGTTHSTVIEMFGKKIFVMLRKLMVRKFTRIALFTILISNAAWCEDYVQLARKIFNSHSRLIEKKHHLSAYGAGGSLGYDLNTLAKFYA